MSSLGASQARRHWAAVGLAVLLWAGFMVWLQSARFDAGFHYEYEDDALAHQSLWSIPNGTFPANTIHPLHRPSHLEPVLFVLWPLYAGLAALWGAWGALWTLKALVLGSGALAVFGLARREGLSLGASLAWPAAYLAGPATIGLVLSTFRPVALAAAPLLFLLWAFRARRFGAFVALLLLTLSFREDLALALVPLAAVALWRRMPHRFAIAALFIPVTWFLVATQWLLPFILPARYEDIVFGANVGPSLLARALDPTHWVAILAVLLPTLGLSLLAPEAAIGLASAAAVLVFKGGFAGNLMHFIAPLTAAGYGGAVIGHAWLQTRSPRASERLAWAALALTLLVHVTPTGLAVVATDCAHNGQANAPGLCEAWSPFSTWFRTGDAGQGVRVAAAAQVPVGDSVAVVGHLLPLFTPRRTLWEYGHADVPFATADWIVLEGVDRYAGAGRYLALGEVDVSKHLRLLARGYEVAWSDGGVVVLKRSAEAVGLTDEVRKLLPKREVGPELRRGVRSPGTSTSNKRGT